MVIKKIRIKNGTPIDINDARIVGIDSTPTLNSTNVVTSGGVKSALDGITEKIPSQASSTNQLADKAFVNSSIETATAEFKGTFNSLAELEQVTANKNDYGFVISIDASGNTVYNRYKYNGTEWLFEYSLNNSSFTAAQWAAIQSGITSALVAKLNGIAAGAEVNVLDGVKVNGVAQTVTDKKVDISVPTALSQLSADATHRVVTDSEKTTWNGKYTKPSSGIPKSDLASDVQTSLGKADTAIQSHQDISGKEDKSNKVTSISSSSTDTQYPSAKAVYTGLAAKQNKAYVNNNTLYL